jgi:hypothetical protein
MTADHDLTPLAVDQQIGNQGIRHDETSHAITPPREHVYGVPAVEHGGGFPVGRQG